LGRVPWCAWSLWRLHDQRLQRRLSVGTVDPFQGQERDIMAITLMRSKPQGEIGCLRTTTRPKKGSHLRCVSAGLRPGNSGLRLSLHKEAVKLCNL
jgi:hypothetical protein